ncbi:Photosystem I assembly protein Ycf4 [Apostasia shenzhenica]|uniref:Photosystem I assembly protein Ycf4 n=1 Tax=Apostasia shenzhenica TaxID=1088818 RepID=A0A2I0A0I5_9ASPA|nr:Photosystem I assembly protein Ycf4 [Apostasia shenzhenica]
MEVREGLFSRRVLYMEIRGQGTLPLTRTDENLTPREIEQKAAELAYFLGVPIENLLFPTPQKKMMVISDWLVLFFIDVTDGRIRKRLWIENVDAISAVAAAGDRLYFVSWDKTLKIWSTTRLRCLESVAAHEDAVNAVAVADDGTVYTGSADRRIRVWAILARAKRHELVATLDRHQSAVHALALSSNGSLLYSDACDRARERAHNRDLRP